MDRSDPDGSTISGLIEQARWEEARRLIDDELEKDPRNHWLITQRGVTLYEQFKYEDSLKCFLAALEIVPDCPLALWNFGGALDQLGNHSEAMKVFTWLLTSRKSPEDDPCWESEEWSDALKADCVYRIGVCFRHLGKVRKAGDCLRQYLSLLSAGIDGIYSLDDVREEMLRLLGKRKQSATRSELRKAVSLASQQQGIRARNGRNRKPPKFSERELLTGRRVAAKK
jgi:tetratricopeptide (TPR) repeat protein